MEVSDYEEASQKLGITPQELFDRVKSRDCAFKFHSFGTKYCGCALTQLVVEKTGKDCSLGFSPDLNEAKEALDISPIQCWQIVHGFDDMERAKSDKPFFNYGKAVRELVLKDQ